MKNNNLTVRERMAHRRAIKIARKYRIEKKELMQLHHIPEGEAISAIRYYIATTQNKRLDAINNVIRVTPTVLLAIVCVLLATRII